MKNIFVLAAILLSMGASASAVRADDIHYTATPDSNGFRHAQWSLSNGASISIDYQTSYIGYNDTGGAAGTFASPWINISGGGISSTDTVSVVLLSYGYYFEAGFDTAYTNPYQESNQTINLKYDSSRSKFTGQATSLVIGPTDDDYSDAYYEEVAVVINGQWYKATNGNNFKIQLPH